MHTSNCSNLNLHSLLLGIILMTWLTIILTLFVIDTEARRSSYGGKDKHDKHHQGRPPRTDCQVGAHAICFNLETRLWWRDVCVCVLMKLAEHSNAFDRDETLRAHWCNLTHYICLLIVPPCDRPVFCFPLCMFRVFTPFPPQCTSLSTLLPSPPSS